MVELRRTGFLLGKILPRHLKILPIGFEALRVRGVVCRIV
jgi:hypothetical protein